MGDGNLGTSNAAEYRVGPPGWSPAIWDLFKGPLAYARCVEGPRVAEPWILTAGRLHNRGSSLPVLPPLPRRARLRDRNRPPLHLVGMTLERGWLSPAEVIVLALAYGGLAFVYHTRVVPNAILLPIYLAALVWRSRLEPDLWFDVFVFAIVAFIWINAVLTLRAERVLRLGSETRGALKEIRVLLRPARARVPVLYLFLSKDVMLAIVGSVRGCLPGDRRASAALATAET